MRKGSRGAKYKRWTADDEREIKLWYAPGTWWGMSQLAEILGTTIRSLDAHIRVMKRKGRI